MTHSELAKKAVAWISQARQDNPEKPLSKLVEEAAMRFNLGPRDVEFLERFLAEQER